MASVFDIEATSFYNENDEKQCCMYAWVFGLNGRCIRGRTWKEFITVINKLVYAYNLSVERRLVIYVHNLSYEFQFFKNYFEWETVFAMDTHKPLYAVTKNGIEFRCSYLLSGYSLEVLAENLTKYKTEKMVGDLDYSKLRHTRTDLTEKEWNYILHDGTVVMAHIQEEIERLGNLNKLPLTKTGYVRNLCRDNCLKSENKWSYISLMKRLTLTPETYKQAKRTYIGGFTHANVNYVDRVIPNVHSFDFTSSYPAVMVSEKYPMSKPFPIDIKSVEHLLSCLKTYCCMFDCTFHNLRSTVNFDNYISISRCLEAENYLLNNGRVIEADKVTVALTEQDFFIISEMYEWDSMDIHNFNAFYKDYLPKDFILTILNLYKDKTELKGVEGKEVEYLVAKGMANACYGMCVTDICKDENLYEENSWLTRKADIETLVEKYNINKGRFLYYPWGVWVTAYARANLFRGILEFREDYIYSDTDSIKCININKHMKFIEEYNVRVTEKINACLSHYDIPLSMACPKTIKGVEKPLGVWDYEGMYTRFKTLGAKRYMVEEDGKIKITIAGVSKKEGVKYLYEKFKTNDRIFEEFKETLEFPSHYVNSDGVEKNGSGKLCHTYIDTNMNGYFVDYLGYKWYYEESSGVHMENTHYKLTLDDEFRNLITGVKNNYTI